MATRRTKFIARRAPSLMLPKSKNYPVILLLLSFFSAFLLNSTFTQLYITCLIGGMNRIMTSFPSGPRFLLLRDHSGSSKRQGPYNHSLWPFDEKSVFYHSNTLGASSLTPWILNGGLDGKGGGGVGKRSIHMECQKLCSCRQRNM